MTEIEKYEPQAPIGGNPAHVRLGVNQVALVADYLAQSGLFKLKPRGGNERPMTQQEVFAIVMAGQALGIGPMPAMMSFHLIEGKPEMSANLQAYFIKSSGKYDYRSRMLRDAEGAVVGCTVDIIDTRSGEVIGESTFTHDDAVVAGLAGGHNYKKYPGNMFFARAITNAIAFHCPDAVPFRIYGDGEISGQGASAGTDGVQAVAGEGPPSPTRVESIVDAALAGEKEEVIQDADVELVEPAVNDPDPEAPAEPDRFSPQAVETKLREDLPKLDNDQRVIVKATVEAEGLPWGYASIVDLIIKAGYTDVFSWLRAEQNAVTPAATHEPEDSPPAGVTGQQTGSQTETTVSDAQVRLFNAKCSEAGFTEAERKTFLKKFAQVDSSRAIAKKDFDELLAALKDIRDGGEATKTAYLGD